MPTKLCEGLAIEEEQALGGSAGRCARGRTTSSGGNSLLVMPQQCDLVIGQTELGIGDRILWRGHRCWREWMRGGREVKVVDEGDDTLTESCEGAVNFMVIEIRVGSLQELPVVVL